VVDYWAKAGLLCIGLAAATWVTIAYGMAYRHTHRGRYVSNALAYLFNSGVMLYFGYQFIQSDGRHPKFFPIGLLLFLSLSQLANLWWQLDPQPPYRHTREIMLFWRPPAIQSDPDPARGLHVPAASPAPLSPQTQRRISGLVMVVAVAVVLASITFILLI
jgi:hypothetical protein